MDPKLRDLTASKCFGFLHGDQEYMPGNVQVWMHRFVSEGTNLHPTPELLTCQKSHYCCGTLSFANKGDVCAFN